MSLSSLLPPKMASRPRRSVTPLMAVPTVPKISWTRFDMISLMVRFTLLMIPKIELSSSPPSPPRLKFGGGSKSLNDKK